MEQSTKVTQVVLRRIRQLKGYKLRHFAEFVGIDRSALSRQESHQSQTVPIDLIFKYKEKVGSKITDDEAEVIVSDRDIESSKSKAIAEDILKMIRK